MDVFLNVYEMVCELNQVVQKDMLQYLVPLSEKALDAFTHMYREDYKDTG